MPLKFEIDQRLPICYRSIRTWQQLVMVTTVKRANEKSAAAVVE